MYKISEEDLQKLLAYLGTCPYVQVYKLVEAIKGLQKIEEKKEE